MTERLPSILSGVLSTRMKRAVYIPIVPLEGHVNAAFESGKTSHTGQSSMNSCFFRRDRANRICLIVLFFLDND